MFSLRSFRRSLLRLVPRRFFSEVAGLEPFEADAELATTIADPISKKCVCVCEGKRVYDVVPFRNSNLAFSVKVLEIPSSAGLGLPQS